MKYRLLLVLVSLLAGCATTNQLTLASYNYDNAPLLPELSVFSARPDTSFASECEEFDAKSMLHHCEINSLELNYLYSQLKEPGIFREVSYANRDTPYRLVFTTAFYNLEDGSELGSAVVAGATLMLMPLVMEVELKVDVRLLWHDYELKRYQYTLPMEMRASLLSMEQDHDRDAAKTIISHLLSDLQDTEVFTPQYLAREIQATNYTALVVPDNAGMYRRQGSHVYESPFLGASFRYLNQRQSVDHADIYIYPIRSAHWRDYDAVLENEAANIRKDIEYMQTTGEYFGLKFSDTTKLLYPDAQGSSSVPWLSFEAEYADSLENLYVSRTYITISKDKFIKVRQTELAGENVDADSQGQQQEIPEFLKQWLGAINIPDESVFMAKVRKGWRDKERL